MTYSSDVASVHVLDRGKGVKQGSRVCATDATRTMLPIECAHPSQSA